MDSHELRHPHFINWTDYIYFISLFFKLFRCLIIREMGNCVKIWNHAWENMDQLGDATVRLIKYYS